jgi:enoyl-CoA hydratase
MSLEIDRSDPSGIIKARISYNKVNALSIAQVRDLISNIEAIGASKGARVLLLGHQGKGFCVGADVKELNSDNNLIGACNAGWYKLFHTVYQCPIPVISVIDGYCIGGGIGIAGASDMVYASPQSTFSLPEVKVGALGGGSHLIRLVGQFKGREMMYTGATITAAEAAEQGNVKLIDAADVWDAALETAGLIAANNEDAVRLAKESLNFTDHDINRSYRFEQGFTLELYTSPGAAKARQEQVKKGFKS